MRDARLHRAQQGLPAGEAVEGGAAGGRAVLGEGVGPGAVVAVFGEGVEAVHWGLLVVVVVGGGSGRWGGGGRGRGCEEEPEAEAAETGVADCEAGDVVGFSLPAKEGEGEGGIVDGVGDGGAVGAGGWRT